MVSSLPELVYPGEWFRLFLRPEPRPLLLADLCEDENEGWGEGMGLWPMERLPPPLPTFNTLCWTAAAAVAAGLGLDAESAL